MARLPFTIRPGDWFKTRPPALDPNMPAPRCRESLTYVPRKGHPIKDREDRFTVQLPHNYKFGPVYSVSVRRYLGSWMMLVEVPSIFNEEDKDMQLKCFVIISNGVTQWARWQCNTGDPRSHGEEKKARGNLSKVEVDLRPRQCYERTWHSLPATKGRTDSVGSAAQQSRYYAIKICMMKMDL